MSDFYIEYAAHEGHGILHTSDHARLGLGIAAFAVGATVSMVTSGGLTIPVIISAAGTGASWGSIGIFAGGFVDPALPKEKECWIVSGHESVRLGPQCKRAARAHPDTSVAPHHACVREGSRTVFIAGRPMSRHRDRTTCTGEISEGITSVLVAGAPSEQGREFVEEDSQALKYLKAAFAFISAANSVTGVALAGTNASPGEMVGAANDALGLVGVDTGLAGATLEAVANGSFADLASAGLGAMGATDANNILGAGKAIYGVATNGPPSDALGYAKLVRTVVLGAQSAQDYADGAVNP